MAASLFNLLSRARPVLVLAVLVIICGCRTAKPKHEITVATVKSDIQANLPIGSSRADVLAYLNHRKIPHGWDKTGEEGLIQDVRKDGFLFKIFTSIQIDFKFDESDSKLVSYSVYEVYTWP
jgi:hypothetical protein